MVLFVILVPCIALAWLSWTILQLIWEALSNCIPEFMERWFIDVDWSDFVNPLHWIGAFAHLFCSCCVNNNFKSNMQFPVMEVGQ